MANISTEEKYRRQALSFLSEINSARELLPEGRGGATEG